MSTESSTERIRAFLEEWMEALDPTSAEMSREQLVACCVEAGIPQTEVNPLVDDLMRERATERAEQEQDWKLEPEDASRIVDKLFAELEGDGVEH